ncbi:hypothetical protein CL619_03950 [archaeon]|nr:hypothetical protein [archaeon]|tara:strand:- start:3360 stop:4049 length:690 start_codon:yes stop_codon:yes gene_type:complete
MLLIIMKAERFEINRWPSNTNLTGRHITVDLDDVLGEYMQGFIDFYNTKHETRFLRSDLVRYDLAHYLGEKPSTIDRLVADYSQTEEYANMKVTSGAYQTLINLKDQGAKLTVLTSRFEGNANETSAWICANYPGIFSEIVYANGMNKSKGELAHKIGSNLHIDDAPKHLIDVRQYGIRGVVYSAPWNQDMQESNDLLRANNFSQVEEVALQLLERSRPTASGLYVVGE